METLKILTKLSIILFGEGHQNICLRHLEQLELQQLPVSNITNNSASLRLLKKLDALKLSSLTTKKSEVFRKRRQVIRGQRKKKQDRHEKTEEPSYEAGVFCYLPVLVI